MSESNVGMFASDDDRTEDRIRGGLAAAAKRRERDSKWQRKPVLPNDPGEAPRDLEAVAATLSLTIHELRAGEIDAAIGREVISGCRTLLPVLEKLDHQRAMEALEDRLSQVEARTKVEGQP